MDEFMGCLGFVCLVLGVALLVLIGYLVYGFATGELRWV